MDLAVGVIIGGAFGKIVDSIVKRSDHAADLAWVMGGKLDFSGMFVVLGKVPEGTRDDLCRTEKGAEVLNYTAYGNFVTILVNFIILAFIIFMMVKQVNKLRKVAPPTRAEPATATAEDILLLREIRDSLKK